MDKLFKVEVLASTLHPQTTIWCGMHQCYSECLVAEELDNRTSFPTETKCGEWVVKHLLKGHRGHYSPTELATIVFNVGYFPHDVVQQITRHRVGISFSVQSFRYTSKRIVDLINTYSNDELEKVFYFRPAGLYTNREGKKYEWTESDRQDAMNETWKLVNHYAELISYGVAEEHARSIMPYSIRQHFVMGANVRSLMHLLDMRLKKDAQLESQQLSELLLERFKVWCPEVANWYIENRAWKGRLAP